MEILPMFLTQSYIRILDINMIFKGAVSMKFLNT